MKKLLFLLAVTITFMTYANAQLFPQWGNLTPGKFKIGYKTIVKTDASRTYGSQPRVVQMYMWYPARSGTGTKASYGQYFKDVANDWGGNKNISENLGRMLKKDFRSGALNPSFAGEFSDEAFQKILETPIPVMVNATPETGKFPLVLHITSNGALHQSVMMEYLASHGYVVISISMYGSSPAFYGRGEAGAKGLHAMTEDLAFVIAQSRSVDFVDTAKTAAIGLMAQAGISLQMKEELLDAIVCLDCHTDQRLLRMLPYYDPKRLRIKMLQVLNSAFPVEVNYMLDSLIYSERFETKIEGLQHPDFYPFPRIAAPETARDHVKYELILRNTLLFLDYALQLKGTYQAGSSTTKKHDPAANTPTEAEFLQWLRYGQMQQVRHAWKQFGKDVAGQENFFSVVLFLARDKSEFAREAYEMYSSAYPNDSRLKMISQFLSP